MKEVVRSSRKRQDASQSWKYDSRTNKKQKVEEGGGTSLKFLSAPGDENAEPYPMADGPLRCSGHNDHLQCYNRKTNINQSKGCNITTQLRMKFITPKGADEIYAEYEKAKSCYLASTDNKVSQRNRHNKENKTNKTLGDSDIIDLLDEIPGTLPKPSEELEPIKIYGN
ncbi:uncharacterized protein G2W53_033023 [Senna tora]|uniref:Uncharacterized protein n=1 Tax=Senna tora TaxID=362788 RepID=A0A834W7I1_9FABA|nr:uncharacterized protein G2W53_033023 [Senna tora]